MYAVRRAVVSKCMNIISGLSRHRPYNVTVVGGGSELGQTVCMLLRNEPAITKLTVHDALPSASGAILDLSHIPAESQIKGYTGEENLPAALAGSDLVIAAGGMIETSGFTTKDIFEENIKFVKSFAKALSEVERMPFVGIATEPINALVPMAAEIIRVNGVFDPKKMFGITGIDSMRAQCMYAAKNNLESDHCLVPVIGGHSEKTMVPLLSHAIPPKKLSEDESMELIARIRKGDELTSAAKLGHGLALAQAYSVLLFTRGILSALGGKLSPVQAFVENNDFGTSFFSGQVYVKADGAKEMQRYTNLTNFECDLLEQSIQYLRDSIIKGRKIVEYE